MGGYITQCSCLRLSTSTPVTHSLTIQALTSSFVACLKVCNSSSSSIEYFLIILVSCLRPYSGSLISPFFFLTEGSACRGIFCCFYHDFFSLWLFHGFQGLGSEEGLLITDVTCSFSLFSPQTLENGKPALQSHPLVSFLSQIRGKHRGC